MRDEKNKPDAEVIKYYTESDLRKAFTSGAEWHRCADSPEIIAFKNISNSINPIAVPDTYRLLRYAKLEQKFQEAGKIMVDGKELSGSWAMGCLSMMRTEAIEHESDAQELIAELMNDRLKYCHRRMAEMVNEIDRLSKDVALYQAGIRLALGSINELKIALEKATT